MSNIEKTFINDDILKEKFTENELGQVINNAKNEAKIEYLMQQRKQESQWVSEKQSIEKYWQQKVYQDEKRIIELQDELEKFTKNLKETRLELDNMTQQSQILEKELTKLNNIES